MIRKSKTDQWNVKGLLVFGSERSAKLVSKWLRPKPKGIQPVFCVINHGRCERPSDLEISGHSLHINATQDLLIGGCYLTAIMHFGG